MAFLWLRPACATDKVSMATFVVKQGYAPALRAASKPIAAQVERVSAASFNREKIELF